MLRPSRFPCPALIRCFADAVAGTPSSLRSAAAALGLALLIGCASGAPRTEVLQPLPASEPSVAITRIEVVLSGPRQGLRIEGDGPVRGRILAASAREILLQLVDARIPPELPIPRDGAGRFRSIVAQPPAQLRVITSVASEAYLEPDGDALRLVLRGGDDQLDRRAGLTGEAADLQPLLGSPSPAQPGDDRAAPRPAPTPAGAPAETSTAEPEPLAELVRAAEPPAESAGEEDLIPIFEGTIEEDDLGVDELEATAEPRPAAKSPTTGPEATRVPAEEGPVPLFDPSSPASGEISGATFDAPTVQAEEPPEDEEEGTPETGTEPPVATTPEPEVLELPRTTPPAEPGPEAEPAVAEPRPAEPRPAEPVAPPPPPPREADLPEPGPELPPISRDPDAPVTGPPTTGPAARRLLGVELGPSPLIRIRGDGEMTWTLFYLADPQRIVLDLPGLDVETTDRELVLESSLIRRVRVGQFRPDVARVVLDLAAPARLRVRRDGSELVLSPIPDPGNDGAAPR